MSTKKQVLEYFIASLLIIGKHWKLPRSPSTIVSKLWYIHTTEHYNSENEPSTKTYENVDESQKNNVDKRSQTHEVMLHDSIYIKSPK